MGLVHCPSAHDLRSILLSIYEYVLLNRRLTQKSLLSDLKVGLAGPPCAYYLIPTDK